MFDYSFSDFAGDEQVFFAQYFNKRPMLRRGALKGDPRDILSFQKVDDLLNLESFGTPYLRITQGPRAVSASDYTRNTVVQRQAVSSVVVPERVYELFRGGATIALGTLNNVIPSLRSLARVFSEKFAVQSDVSAFMTPAGNRGRSPHRDAPDVFVVQLEGTKRWLLWDPPAVRRTTRKIFDSIEELGDPIMDVLLEPGDILYVPFNTPHAAEAEDQMSLHAAITIRPRLWDDLLQLTVAEILRDPAFSEFPYLATPDTEAVRGEFNEMLDVLQKKLSSIDPASEIDRLLRVGRLDVEGGSTSHVLQNLARVDQLDADTELIRSAAAVDFFEKGPHQVTVSVNGRCVDTPASVAAALGALGFGESTSAARLCQDAPGIDAVTCTQELARLGALELS